MHIVGSTMPDAKEARLFYRQIERLASHGTLIEVQLETGRKHQIRLQMSHHGHPIVGDRKYGSPTPFPAGIALHARQLTVAHPTTGESLTFLAPLPTTWRRFELRDST
jgi:23S rRNA pseudouridine1911/1915/1917 synthase